MTTSTHSRLAVIGAGAVGASVALSALLRESAREIVLYDIDRDRVEAEVLDLAHGSLYAGASRVSGGADLALVAGADVVVVTAGAKQAPGQTRLELAAANVALLERLLPGLLGQAPDAVYLFVTNPCDVVTMAARRISGLPASRVIGSGTVLDSSRLRWTLAERLGVARESVHALIVGEHGDTEFPLWSQAQVGPVPLASWPGAPSRAALDTIAEDVRTAAYRVIAGKGATNHAIGVAAARIVEAVLRDDRNVLPVSTVLDGYRGISGIALSVPTVVGAGGAEQVLDVPYDAEELGRLHRSAAAIDEAARAAGV